MSLRGHSCGERRSAEETAMLQEKMCILLYIADGVFKTLRLQ